MANYSGLNIDLTGLTSGIGSAMIAPGAAGTPAPSPTPAPTPAATAATVANTALPSTPVPAASTVATQNPTDIAARIAQLTGQDSALMRQARAEGMKQANRRGVMNSSIGIGAAQAEALKVAAPIASQESQEKMQRDVQAQTLAAQREQTMAQLASQERGNLLDNFSTQMSNYQQSLAQTLANDKIPAAARAQVQQALRDQLTYGLGWMQKLYGVTVPTG